MQYGSIFIETLFGFLMLLILARVLGKTQIRQLTAFDFIAALILGELVGNALYDDQIGIPGIGFAVLLWGGLLFITEFVTQRFKKTRALLEGKPSIVIHKGVIQREEMRKGKLDMNQLLHLMRAKGVFTVQDIDYAILETDGSVSVLNKTAQQQPTREDLNLPHEQVVMPFMLINDGELIQDNLDEIGRDKAWLLKELEKQNFSSISEVFYAEYAKGQPLFLQGFE